MGPSPPWRSGCGTTLPQSALERRAITVLALLMLGALGTLDRLPSASACHENDHRLIITGNVTSSLHEPAAGLQVFANDTMNPALPEWACSGTATTAANGGYEVVIHIHPFDSHGDNVRITVARSGTECAQRNITADLKPGEPADLERRADGVDVTVKPGSLGGKVGDNASGSPLAGVLVRAMLGAEEKKRTFTGSDGAYSLTALPGGSYTIDFTLAGYSNHSEPAVSAACLHGGLDASMTRSAETPTRQQSIPSMGTLEAWIVLVLAALLASLTSRSRRIRPDGQSSPGRRPP